MQNNRLLNGAIFATACSIGPPSRCVHADISVFNGHGYEYIAADEII